MNQPTLRRRHPELPNGRLQIDPSVWFGVDVEIDATGDLTIGRGTCLLHGVRVLTHTHTNFTGPVEGGLVGPVKNTPVVIGANVLILEGAVILPGCREIADWSVVGAYSVLSDSIRVPGSVWRGNPAQFVKMRKGFS